MRRLIITLAATAAAMFTATSAQAATVSCPAMGANSGERCSYVRHVRHVQLWGTGRFDLGLPGGWEGRAVYVSPGHWWAYASSLWPVTGYVYVRNNSSRSEFYWGGVAG